MYITPDLSVQERKIQKELRAELKRRKDNDESNLKFTEVKLLKLTLNQIPVWLLILLLLLNLTTIQIGSPHQSYQGHSDCRNIGKSNITFCYTNADSLYNKINELKVRLSSLHPDILAITEVCPKHYHVPIPPESLHLQGYDLFCSDFSGSRGVCLYCKSSLKADKYDNSKFNDFKESLWCSVPVDKNNFILVGVIYRSPSSSTDNELV